MEPNKSSKNITVNHYVCALVDVLGQQDELRQLDAEHAFSNLGAIDEDSDFSKSLKRCYATILNFRMIIEENLARWYPTIEDIHLADAEWRANVQLAVSQPVTTRSFSDLMVVYASINTTNAHVPLAPIWRTICALMFCQLRALAEGRTQRGGIELGLGFEFGSGDLYGPVLSRAYSLESDVAQYPRIVVGDRLIQFVEEKANSTEGAFGVLNCSMARQVQRAFLQDVDGRFILDFAGPAHHEWIKAEEWLSASLFVQAHTFVRSECERFRAQNNSRLAFRYAHLDDYLQSRANIWTNPPSTFRDIFSKPI